MEKTILLLLTILFFCSCEKETKIDEKYVINKFQENSNKINSLQYQVQNIDSIYQKKILVFNSSGTALLEKNNKDKVFGFSFYGKNNDVPMEYIYDAGNGFEISKAKNTYEVYPGNFGFIGSPGGQMVHQNIFVLDSIYKKVSLTETENSYKLTYEFENDTTYNVSDKVKVFELNKTDFFPSKIKQTIIQNEVKSISITNFSNVKINEEVKSSIKKLKQNFIDYTLIPSKKRESNRLLSKELPLLELPDLLDQNKIVDINNNDKLSLIDFWEVWCSPCIASFHKVENLKNKYSSELNVYGIVSEDLEYAIKLVKKKDATFQNLVGNEELKKKLGINSFPTYFLIDKKGIVQKEYFGFSEQIEKDIKEILAQ